MEIEKQRGISVTSHRAAVRVRRLAHQPARHPRPQGLLRGHLPHPGRRRHRGHADRRRQGRRAADHASSSRSAGCAASRSSPSSTRWTARPRIRSICGRDRAGAGHPLQPGELAAGVGHQLRRRLRPLGQASCCVFERAGRWRASAGSRCGVDVRTTRAGRGAGPTTRPRAREEVELLEIGRQPVRPRAVPHAGR